MAIRERAARRLTGTPRRYASPMRSAPNDPIARPVDWPHYRETVLHFGDPVVWSVHVARLALEATVWLPALGLDAPFAVVTAFHPYPRRLDAAENLVRHERLRQAIAQLEVHATPCDGSSLDGSHREAGFAIVCARDEAKTLANRFDQAAFYWWDGASLWIEPTHAESMPERLDPDTRCHEPGASSLPTDPGGTSP